MHEIESVTVKLIGDQCSMRSFE